MSDFLQHLTLDTGHLRPSPRAEVGTNIRAALQPWLRSTLDSGQPAALPAPDLHPYTCQLTAEHGALLGTVFGPQPTAAGTPDPLVTFAVAPHREQGDLLWALLGQQFPAQRSGRTRPDEPWCAVVLHPSLALDPPAAQWLGDFERCVAWVWIDGASH